MPPRLPQARGNGCRGATGLPSAQGKPYSPGRLAVTHACRKLTLFIQNTSKLLSFENTLIHLVEVPQDGRRCGLKFRLSTSRHCYYGPLQLVYIPTGVGHNNNAERSKA